MMMPQQPMQQRPVVKRSSTPILALVVILAILLLLSFITLLSVNSAKKQLESTLTSYITEVRNLSGQVYELQTSIAALKENMQSPAAPQPTAPTTTPEQPSNPTAGSITITRQPMTVDTVLGRSEALLFSMAATSGNSGVSFTWQKLNSDTNTWEDIKFVYPGNNTDLGIRLYDNSANGETQLWANTLTEQAFGVYRCVVSDAVGNTVTSDMVSCRQKAEE